MNITMISLSDLPKEVLCMLILKMGTGRMADVREIARLKVTCRSMLDAGQAAVEQLVALLFDVKTASTACLAEALCEACEHGYADVVRLLLARPGIDVNARDGDGEAPLSEACEHGREAVVRLLLAHPGIDVNARDGQALRVSCLNGREAVVRLLLAHPGIQVNAYNGEALRVACEWGHEAVVRLLLAHPGIDVNAKDNAMDGDGRRTPPLIRACYNGHEAVVRLLLAHPGIDVNARDEEGSAPLGWACSRGHVAVVRLLLAHPGIDDRIPAKLFVDYISQR
jgi:ankyrin repeat protein